MTQPTPDEPTCEDVTDQQPLKVFYDGQCPICRREIRWVQSRDHHNRIEAIDIESPNFDASAYHLDQQDLRGRIHAICPNGQVVTGVEVFRQIYAKLGMSWLIQWTRLPGARQASDAAYRWFARNRYRLTGRKQPSCDENACHF